jgi:hypothetical protein
VSFISATGNIGGNYIFGNGSQLTGINASGGVVQSATAPSSPTSSTLWWDEVSGTLFVWYDDGVCTQWVAAAPSAGGTGSGSIIQSATAPVDPTSSTLWWDEVSGTLYVWYDDGVCTQWVAAAPSAGGTGSGSIIQSATAPVDPTSSTLWWDEVSGTLYVWYNDGVCTQWVAAAPSAGSGSGSIIQSATAPADPTSSTLWWDEVSGTLYVWYNDGVCTQWVAAAPSAGISTGNVTFDNINIIGDGNLHLQPDSANASDYLDIYLTAGPAGPDIHISGGSGYSGAVILGTDEEANVAILPGGNVAIQAGNVSGTQTWNFGTDGTTTFPTANVDIHNGGVQSGEVLQFGNPNLQSIITGPTPDANVSARRLIIQGQRGNGTGEGGDVYVWAGDSDTNGGDIKIYAGDADNVSTGTGGYINLAGGDGFDNGGHINIDGGSSANATGGAVNIAGGYGQIDGGTASLQGGYGANGQGGAVQITGGGSSNGTGSFGNVVLGSGVSGWIFDNTGNLTLPNDATISDFSDTASLNVDGNRFAQLYWNGNIGNGNPSTGSDYYTWAYVGNAGFAVQHKNASTSTDNEWKFGTDGNLTLPTGTPSINYANGSPYGGGGGANTGNVTFDDQAVVGTGDQVGAGGLYLAPGNTSVGNLQYLRVRGGDVATHIHFDTGNNVYFDQYFGNDNKFVKLEATGNVKIGTSDAISNSAFWTFGVDGNLTLPAGDIITDSLQTVIISGAGTAAVNQTYEIIETGQYVGLTDNDYQIDTPYAPDFNYKLRTGGDAGGFYESADLITWTIVPGAGGGDAPAPDGVIVPRHIALTVDSSSWIFDATGNLTFPTGNLVITPDDAAFGNSAVIASEDHNLITLSTGANGGLSSVWVEDIGNVGTSNIAAVYANPTPGSKIVRIAVGQNDSPGPNLWDFGTGGTMQCPLLTYTTLPSPVSPGQRAFITDSTLEAAGNFGSNAFVGGGSNTVPVFSAGSDWWIG